MAVPITQEILDYKQTYRLGMLGDLTQLFFNNKECYPHIQIGINR